MAVPVSAAFPSARYTTSEPIFHPTKGYRPAARGGVSECPSGQMWVNVCTCCSCTCDGSMRFAPSVDVHEGACSHGDFHIANIKAALSKHGRLLVRHLQQKVRGSLKVFVVADLQVSLSESYSSSFKVENRIRYIK